MRLGLSRRAFNIFILATVVAVVWAVVAHLVFLVLGLFGHPLLEELLADLLLVAVTVLVLYLGLAREDRLRAEAELTRALADAERQKLLSDLERERVLLQAVFDNVPVGLAVFPPRGDEPGRWANPTFEQFAATLLHSPATHVDINEMTLASVSESIDRHDDPQPELGMPTKGARASGWVRLKPWDDQTLPFMTGSGWRWVSTDLRSNGGGEPDTLLLVVDITGWVEARRRIVDLAAAATRRAAELDTIFSAMGDGVLVYDAAGYAGRANVAAVKMLGFDPIAMHGSEVSRKLSLRVQQGDDRPGPEREPMPTEPVSGVQVERVSWSRADGQPIAALITSSPLVIDGTPAGVVTVLHDVTEREELLDRLSAKHAELVAVLQHMPLGILLVEPGSGTVMLQNEQVVRILGHQFDPSGFADRPPWPDEPCPLAPPDDAAHELVAQAVQSGQGAIEREVRYLREDGACISLVITAAPIRNHDRQIAGVLVTFQDITERKQVEATIRSSNADLLSLSAQLSSSLQALSIAHDELRQRNSELWSARELLEAERQRYHDLFELAPEGYFVTDPEGIIREANSAASNLVDQPLDVLVGQTLLAYVAEHDRPLFETRLSELRSAPASGSVAPFGLELALRSRVGADVPVAVTVGCSYGAEGRLSGLRWLMRDITAAKQIEEALRRTHEELEARVRARTRELAQANKSLEQRVVEQTRELSSLAQVSRHVASTTELKPLLNVILDQLAAMIGFSRAAILAVNGDRLSILDQRDLAAGRDTGEVQVTLSEMPTCEAICRERSPEIGSDDGDLSPLGEVCRAFPGLAESKPPASRSWLGIPMAIQGRIIGLMCLEDNEPNHFTEHHARLALAIADQAAVAIENYRLYKEMEWAAAAEERQRLARDLHDSVSQALYGVILASLTLSELMGTTNGKVSEALQYLLRQAQTAVDETRALIFELRPESLQRNGLTAALDIYAGHMQANHNFVVHTSFCAEPKIPIGAKEAFYRIAQQALQNVVQHAHTDRVEISLECGPAETVLEVRDHGPGFNPEAVPPSHIGLRSMRERILRQGGSLEIISSPGAGTVIRARVPTV